MIPIRDHNPSNRFPLVTWILIAINVVVFISHWPLFTESYILNAFYENYALIPVQVSVHALVLPFFTSMFLHGSFLHLAGNMLFLWIFGDNLEDRLGHFLYLLFYLAAGFVAGFMQYVSAPYSDIPVVGASGAIAGVMGGYLLLYPKARVDILLIFIIFFRIIPIPAWLALCIWFILQIFGVIGSDANSGGVAYMAHAAGFAAGAVMVLPIIIMQGGIKHWNRTQGRPPHPEAKYRKRKTQIPSVKLRDK